MREDDQGRETDAGVSTRPAGCISIPDAGLVGAGNRFFGEGGAPAFSAGNVPDESPFSGRFPSVGEGVIIPLAAASAGCEMAVDSSASGNSSGAALIIPEMEGVAEGV